MSNASKTRSTSDKGQLPSDEVVLIDTSAIISRIKEAYLIDSDAELAAALGVAKSTVSAWRQRNSIPLEVCLRVALERHHSLDFIISGREPKGGRKIEYADEIDAELMEICFFAIERKYCSAGQPVSLKDSAFHCRQLLVLYARARTMMNEAIGQQKSKRRAYLDNLAKTLNILDLP